MTSTNFHMTHNQILLVLYRKLKNSATYRVKINRDYTNVIVQKFIIISPLTVTIFSSNNMQ